MISRLSVYINRIRGSKDGSVLLKNFGYLSFLEMATRFFPLITTPYLARVLGVDVFGVLAIGTSVVAYFQTFTNYGFDYTSVRNAARYRNDKDELSTIVSITLFSKFFLMLISIALLALCICFIPFLKDYSSVIWCTFLIIPVSLFNTDWVFQALEDMKYITITSITAKFLFTILIFIFIRTQNDYLWQPVLTAVGALVPSIWGVIILKKKYAVKIGVPSFKSILTELKTGFSMFVTVFLPTIYSQLNTLLLGAYNGKTATGIYSGGTKFTTIAYGIFQLISRTAYPFFSRRMDKHRFYVALSLLLSFIVSILFFVFARPIVMVFLGPEFEEAIVVLKILAFTPVAMSLMNSYGINYLVLRGKESLMRNIVIFVTVFGIGIGVIGAIYYSYVGVAVASLVTQFIRAFLATYFARRIERETHNNHVG